MKRQPLGSEKIFVSETTEKRLISKIQKQLMKLSIKKRIEDLNRHFSKEDIQDGQQTYEKMLSITHY